MYWNYLKIAGMMKNYGNEKRENARIKSEKRTYLRCNVMVLCEYIVNYYHNYSIIIIDIKAGMRRCLSMVLISLW